MNVNSPGVLVHRATGARGAMLFVHNLCRHHCRIRLELQSGENHRPLNVAADAEYDEVIDLLSWRSIAMAIAGYGSTTRHGFRPRARPRCPVRVSRPAAFHSRAGVACIRATPTVSHRGSLRTPIHVPGGIQAPRAASPTMTSRRHR